MPMPTDYPQRVYAGVLGKIIGVYLGRPVEGWTHEQILRECGPIDHYVHEQLNKPLVVSDDDISGTFTFLRALEDYGYPRDITPQQIGRTWLNYIIENRSVLWWGGMGNSTEHTAFLRMSRGVEPPASGSIAVNGKVVAEQIGAQIFIDGWAMIVPGDPQRAADLARRAASVSHDGEAVYGAQVVAAMESQAFVEPDLHKLLDTATRLIPADSVIARMIADLRGWHAAAGNAPDWRRAREKLETRYGYDRFGGGCHMVPNHGVIILALLYGNDDFRQTLMIANTCGWDTDCNSGNVGCLLGIKNGLAAIDAGPVDWRGPVADRLYLPTADGGRAITDAATESFHIINTGRALAGLEPVQPKGGARFHFSLPGSVQGFQVCHDPGAGRVTLRNRDGRLTLAIQALPPHTPARIATDTFIPPDSLAMKGYTLCASPTVYPGQTLRASVSAAGANSLPVDVRLFLKHYDAAGALTLVTGPVQRLAPGEAAALSWRVPALGGQPIQCVGIEVVSDSPFDGVVYLDHLGWDGAPSVELGRPAGPNCGGGAWARAWVDAVDHFYPTGEEEPYLLIQDHGRGMLIQGTRQWADYRVSANLRMHMVKSGGLAARVQGLHRYYALLLDWPGKVRLIRVLDGVTTLWERDLSWVFDRAYPLSLEVNGSRVRAWVDDVLFADVRDPEPALAGGAAGMICEEGRLHAGAVRIEPVDRHGLP